jgi:hypothetical protein
VPIYMAVRAIQHTRKFEHVLVLTLGGAFQRCVVAAADVEYTGRERDSRSNIISTYLVPRNLICFTHVLYDLLQT